MVGVQEEEEGHGMSGGTRGGMSREGLSDGLLWPLLELAVLGRAGVEEAGIEDDPAVVVVVVVVVVGGGGSLEGEESSVEMMGARFEVGKEGAGSSLRMRSLSRLISRRRARQ